MTILLILGFVLFLTGVVLDVIRQESAFIVGVLGAYIISGALWGIIHNAYLTALDVYRGKTTLEITYKDSVAVDSIVVFK